MSLVLSIAYHQEVTENQERMSMLKHIYHMFEMHFESLLGGEISWENATSAILKALTIRGHPPCWKLIDSSTTDFLVPILLTRPTKYLNVYILAVELR